MDKNNDSLSRIEERHMNEIAQLEQEIKQVRARNERLEDEIRFLESYIASMKYGQMGGHA